MEGKEIGTGGDENSLNNQDIKTDNGKNLKNEVDERRLQLEAFKRAREEKKRYTFWLTLNTV